MMRLALILIFAVTGIIRAAGRDADSVLSFEVPSGYTLYRVARESSVRMDTLIRYNPGVKDQLVTRSILYLPARLLTPKSSLYKSWKYTDKKPQEVFAHLTSPTTTPDQCRDDVFLFTIPDGYTIDNLSAGLHVAPDSIYNYNPKLLLGVYGGMQIYMPSVLVDVESVKAIDPSYTYIGGALPEFYEERYTDRSVTQVAARYHAKPRVPTGNDLYERLKKSYNLFHFDKIKIEGQPFWRLDNLSMDVTAGQISDAVGVPLDTLRHYCNYAALLYDYEDEKTRFNEVAQYYLSHPDITRREMEAVSRSMFGGRNYHLT